MHTKQMFLDSTLNHYYEINNIINLKNRRNLAILDRLYSIGEHIEGQTMLWMKYQKFC